MRSARAVPARISGCASDTADLLVETIRGQIAHPLAHYSLGFAASRRHRRHDHLPRRPSTRSCPISIPRKSITRRCPSRQIRCVDGRASRAGRWNNLRCGAGSSGETGRPDHSRALRFVLATMELLGAKNIHVSVRGLRYGVLTARRSVRHRSGIRQLACSGRLHPNHRAARLNTHDRTLSPRNQREALRARYDEEPSHSDHVAALALQIFDGLQSPGMAYRERPCARTCFRAPQRSFMTSAGRRRPDGKGASQMVGEA